jgi:hypothetical protein
MFRARRPTYFNQNTAAVTCPEAVKLGIDDTALKKLHIDNPMMATMITNTLDTGSSRQGSIINTQLHSLRACNSNNVTVLVEISRSASSEHVVALNM